MKGNLITKEFLKKLLRSDLKVYFTSPEMNEHLYLHYKSFRKIENLDEFTNLKVLYLEANYLKQIEGLDFLKELRALYLQENQIQEIKGLDTLSNLHTLNLSDNLIRKIQGLDKLCCLESLQLKRNQIGHNGISDLEGLIQCQTITSIDLAYNFIDTEEILEQIMKKMGNLRIIYFQGNEFIKKMKNYRKVFISGLPTLKHLDDMPVFDDERRYCEAFSRGGLEEEKLERQKVKKEKEEQSKLNLGQWKSVVEKYQRDLKKYKEEKMVKNLNQEQQQQEQKEQDRKDQKEIVQINENQSNYLDDLE